MLLCFLIYRLLEVLARAGRTQESRRQHIWANARECSTVNTTIYITRVKMTGGDEVIDQGPRKDQGERDERGHGTVILERGRNEVVDSTNTCFP